MIPKKISTMFSHEPEVGVKCSVIRGLRSSHAFTRGCLVSSRRESHPPALAEPYGARPPSSAPNGPAGGGGGEKFPGGKKGGVPLASHVQPRPGLGEFAPP